MAEAVFSADGSTVYSAVNGQNRVVAIDAATGAIQQSWAVGNAPRDMVKVGTKLYVSNEGGRPAKPGDTTINSYNTQVPANPMTGATTTGTVSVIDLANPAAAVASIDVGLHPTALYAKNGALFVTNTATNTVSVIDTDPRQGRPDHRHPAVAGGVGRLRARRGDAHRRRSPAGDARPRQRGRRLPVHQAAGAGQLRRPAADGLLPRRDHHRRQQRAGLQHPRHRRPPAHDSAGHGTHDTTSSLQQFTLPSDRAIRAVHGQGLPAERLDHGLGPVAKGKATAKPVPVPQRLGDPSTIKHVFLIVKENRTYDQLFGDIAERQRRPGAGRSSART